MTRKLLLATAIFAPALALVPAAASAHSYLLAAQGRGGANFVDLDSMTRQGPVVSVDFVYIPRAADQTHGGQVGYMRGHEAFNCAEHLHRHTAYQEFSRQGQPVPSPPPASQWNFTKPGTNGAAEEAKICRLGPGDRGRGMATDPAGLMQRFGPR